MSVDLLGPVVTFLAALLGIAGGFWNTQTNRPTRAGIAAGVIAAAGMVISVMTADRTAKSAEASGKAIAELKQQLDKANEQIASTRTELQAANKRLSRLNFDLLNEYAQGGWTGTAPSGSILKTYGLSCDATIRTVSGAKTGEFFSPRGEEVDVPLIGVGGETVQVTIQFPQPQCDGKVIVTGLAP